jgi:hypothetical protein
MKNLQKALLCVAALGLFGASVAKADRYRDSHYDYGHDGYWDNRDHHHYHHWEHYHGHDGYWENQGGTRIFIDI